MVRGMANFAVRLVHGPAWDAGRPIRGQDGWDEHAAFMDGLVEDGFIIVGGPVGDGEQTLHAVEAADENEIRARLALDPWASAGLLQTGTIEPWALWLDGRAARRPGLTGALDPLAQAAQERCAWRGPGTHAEPGRTPPEARLRAARVAVARAQRIRCTAVSGWSP